MASGQRGAWLETGLTSTHLFFLELFLVIADEKKKKL